MLAPFKIEVGRISYPTVVEALCPLLPGGVVVLTLLGVDAVSIGFVKDLGYYTKLGLVAFAAYIVGLMLYYTASAPPFIIGAILSARIPNPHAKSSKSITWRKAVSKLLGDDLSPGPSGSDDEWEQWYPAVYSYALAIKKDTAKFITLAHSYLTLLQSLGWASLIALFLAPGFRHALLFGIATVLIVVGGLLHTLLFVAGFAGGTLTEHQVTGIVIGELCRGKEKTEIE